MIRLATDGRTSLRRTSAGSRQMPGYLPESAGVHSSYPTPVSTSAADTAMDSLKFRQNGPGRMPATIRYHCNPTCQFTLNWRISRTNGGLRSGNSVRVFHLLPLQAESHLFTETVHGKWGSEEEYLTRVENSRCNPCIFDQSDDFLPGEEHVWQWLPWPVWPGRVERTGWSWRYRGHRMRFGMEFMAVPVADSPALAQFP